jgi:hypothetical protein
MSLSAKFAALRTGGGNPAKGKATRVANTIVLQKTKKDTKTAARRGLAAPAKLTPASKKAAAGKVKIKIGKPKATKGSNSYSYYAVE